MALPNDSLGSICFVEPMLKFSVQPELVRIVSMLTRLIQRTQTVAEDAFEYEENQLIQSSQNQALQPGSGGRSTLHNNPIPWNRLNADAPPEADGRRKGIPPRTPRARRMEFDDLRWPRFHGQCKCLF